MFCANLISIYKHQSQDYIQLRIGVFPKIIQANFDHWIQAMDAISAFDIMRYSLIVGSYTFLLARLHLRARWVTWLALYIRTCNVCELELARRWRDGESTRAAKEIILWYMMIYCSWSIMFHLAAYLFRYLFFLV
jgi:hypothetical protein